MSEPSENPIRPDGIYCLKVYGHQKPRWRECFVWISVTSHVVVTTTLLGSVVDQPALYGIISRVRDLGLTLLAVERLSD
jgi:hypothetical protein